MQNAGKNAGFSLIELVVAVGIVGILAAIAIPGYAAYIKQANRADAVRTMSADAQALERCYSQNFQYVGCTSGNIGAAASAQGYYTVTVAVTAAVPNVSSATYTISAVPLTKPQTNDLTCSTFTLDNTGKQSAMDNNSNNTTKTCWGST